MTNKQTDVKTEANTVRETSSKSTTKATTKKMTAPKSPAKKKPQPKFSPGKPKDNVSEVKAGDVVEAAAPDKSPSATDAAGEPKKILGGKRKAVAIADLKTGELYLSKSKAGKALAEEFGLDPNDSFVWYKIVKKAPDRFEER